MIEKVDILDVPESSRQVKPNWEFIQNMIKRFEKSDMEACRVEGWPSNTNINSKRSTTWSAIKHLKLQDKIEMRSDKVNIFLVKKF